MFYIIEGENVTEGEKGQFLVDSDGEFFLVSEIENATVFNRKRTETMVKTYQQYGENITLDGALQITHIHSLRLDDKRDFKEFIETEKMELSYNVGDIIDFDGNLYEVEGVENSKVQLSHEDGCEFSVEFEYIKLVCKAKDRIKY